MRKVNNIPIPHRLFIVRPFITAIPSSVTKHSESCLYLKIFI